MPQKLFFISFIIALTVAVAFGQKTLTSSPKLSPTPLPTPFSMENALTEAEKQTDVYRENFNNLLAEETKTF
ncbi:MAG: hypothetical protein LC768_05640, partial [Acidobacteria bacterium]|nr:hypothetical protein [Acidobacteriota bacterium]